MYVLLSFLRYLLQVLLLLLLILYYGFFLLVDYSQLQLPFSVDQGLSKNTRSLFSSFLSSRSATVLQGSLWTFLPVRETCLIDPGISFQTKCSKFLPDFRRQKRCLPFSFRGPRGMVNVGDIETGFKDAHVRFGWVKGKKAKVWRICRHRKGFKIRSFQSIFLLSTRSTSFFLISLFLSTSRHQGRI